MAKKKRPRRDKKPKRTRRANPGASVQSVAFDRRIMERGLQQVGASLLGEPEQDTPLRQAQELMYQAFEERDAQRRAQLALAALDVSGDCADAYVLLAEMAPSRQEALKLYEQGTAAGERALGPLAFQRDVGHFWGIVATRPYMRAREGLATLLWTTGRQDEAVGHLQDMLRLNPNDNQGLRYTLAAYLALLDRDDDLGRLLEQYPGDESAVWEYGRALLAFRQLGDTIPSRQLLKKAKKSNKHVPAYLLGHKFLPVEQPAYYGRGDENEALLFSASFMGAWRSTPGAITWLRAQQKAPAKRQGRPAAGPDDAGKKWLKERFPQQEDVWQADIRQLSLWAGTGSAPIRPWGTFVVSRSHELVVGHAVGEDRPEANSIWDTLVKAMRHPLSGTPHRPTELQVRPHPFWESLKPHFEEIGLKLVFVEELEQIEVVVQDMLESIGAQEVTGLLDVPGITPEHVGRFYEAAAAFYSQAPWKKVGFEAAIKIAWIRDNPSPVTKGQHPSPPLANGEHNSPPLTKGGPGGVSGPWYAVIMGRLGLTLGLALYDDFELLRDMWSDGAVDDENAQDSATTSVIFHEPFNIPVTDLDAAEKYGWKVAGPEAYPDVFHLGSGDVRRPPLAWELKVMEGCLRAIPDYLMRHGQLDATEETMTVPVTGGDLQLTLAWVGGND